MNLTDEEREALVIARKARAFDTWEETKGIVECGYWHAAANRMYYACYYMTTALLIKNGFQASTHSGVIRLYSKLFELRQSGDYDDWIVIDANEILPLMDSVDNYLNTLLSLIEGKA